MQTSHATRPAALGDTVRAASRQVWLAGLGAAVVTRGWAERETGNVFRTLVREGTTVEPRAMRFVGDRIETSVTRANALWRHARSTVERAVKDYAGTAVTIVRETLPRNLAKVELPALLRRERALTAPAAARRKTGAKAQRASAAKRVKTVKRGAGRTAKRATRPTVKRGAGRTAKRAAKPTAKRASKPTVKHGAGRTAKRTTRR